MLRYLSSFDPESQIIISKRPDDTYEVTRYWPVDTKRNIASQVADIVEQSGETDPVTIAKMISVRVEQIAMPSAAVEALMKEYSALRISPMVERHYVLDGTRYDCWFSTYTNGMFHFSFVDGDENNSQHPLVRWMGEVRDQVEKAQNRGAKR